MNRIVGNDEFIFACSSGVLGASIDFILDSILADSFTLDEAHQYGDDIAKEIVKLFAGSLQEDTSDNRKFGDLLKSFEDNKWVKNPVDGLTDDYSGGSKHHLYDFAHHPTPVGLFCSIAMNITGYGTGTEKNGVLEYNKNADIQSVNIIQRAYYGTVGWVLHLISDIAGSSSSRLENSDGTGIPGVFLSTLKEISSLPILRNIKGKDSDGNYVFAQECQKLFDGTKLGPKFDFRTELGIGLKAKQYISVLICEGIIAAFYSVKKLFEEIIGKNINTIEDIVRVDIMNVLSFNSDIYKRMRTISSVTFSTVDLSSAAFKSFATGNGSKEEQLRIFLTNINYFGVGRLLVAGTGEMGMKMETLYVQFQPVIARTKEEIDKKLDHDVSNKAFSTVGAIKGLASPIGFIAAAIGVYKEISTSITEYNIAKEERIQIEAECAEAIELLTEYQDEMEAMVSEYMIDRLTIFGESLDMMDEALASGDTDSFIGANNQIQNKLGRDSQFASTDEFDALMSSDDTFKL